MPYPSVRYVRYGRRYLTQVVGTMGMYLQYLPWYRYTRRRHTRVLVRAWGRPQYLTQVLGTLGTDPDTLPKC